MTPAGADREGEPDVPENGGADGGAGVDPHHDLEALVERAEEATEGLREAAGVDDADLSELVDTVDEDAPSETGEYVRDLLAVVDEFEDVLETIELGELPEAVDFSELPELLAVDELPEAIDEGDAGELVKLRKLADVVDFSELWDAADVRELWRQKREMDDAVEDVTDGGDGDDEGMLDELTDDEGMMDDVDADDMDFDGIEDYDPETAENAIQAKLMAGVEEFRETVMDAHERLDSAQERVSEEMPEQDRETNSRNPTAVSTMPSRDRPDIGNAARFSTVPRETLHSTAPNMDRLYGDRFKRENENE